ncbi:hypothetical protein SAMD00079811_70420 [Scytonema sp. HK-05]|nr:hypothetical protein SAMD00079811_70420 [Scytonema sp. HK-05]
MTPLEKGMIYELRIYDAMPGRRRALLSRFQNHTLQIWEKHGICQAGFWTTLIGENQSNRLTYLLAWDSMAERQERSLCIPRRPRMDRDQGRNREGRSTCAEHQQ